MDRSIAFALISMVFAGVTAVLAKAGMRNVSGDVALLVRSCLIFGLVWGNAFAFRQLKELALLTTRDALFLCLSGATTFFSWLFYYRAMKEGIVSVVATLDKASIVVTLVLSFLVLREPYLARGPGRLPHPVRLGGAGVEVGG
jgi:transporter family protein